MTVDLPKDSIAIQAAALLTHYHFELGTLAIEPQVLQWLERYPASWLKAAVIEALYQGRYKAISVEQILACWQRRSHPLPHFNLEFERIICSQTAPKTSPTPRQRQRSLQPRTSPILPDPTAPPDPSPPAWGHHPIPTFVPGSEDRELPSKLLRAVAQVEPSVPVPMP